MLEILDLDSVLIILLFFFPFSCVVLYGSQVRSAFVFLFCSYKSIQIFFFGKLNLNLIFPHRSILDLEHRIRNSLAENVQKRSVVRLNETKSCRFFKTDNRSEEKTH
jgi:hypothetical protein